MSNKSFDRAGPPQLARPNGVRLISKAEHPVAADLEVIREMMLRTLIAAGYSVLESEGDCAMGPGDRWTMELRIAVKREW